VNVKSKVHILNSGEINPYCQVSFGIPLFDGGTIDIRCGGNLHSSGPCQVSNVRHIRRLLLVSRLSLVSHIRMQPVIATMFIDISPAALRALQLVHPLLIW
jgi:hypothetical protein